MKATTAPAASPSPRRPTAAVAPLWHTGVVLCFMLGVSFVGARVALNRILPINSRVTMYLVSMIAEWAMVAFIWWGLARRGNRLSDLLGGSWARPIQFFRDMGIGVGFLVVGGGAVQGLASLLGASQPRAVGTILPQTRWEIGLWVLLSATAGFCEELIFRGYLQRQFSSLSRSLGAGIVLQALTFGLSHGYQGWKWMLIIAAYGAGFGLLAHWRRSLLPGMLGHAMQDTASGLVTRFVLR